MTVNRNETCAVLSAFETATGQKPQTVTIGEKVYRDLGVLNGARVMLALSEMGTSGPGSSLQAVSKGIAALHPAAVVMVGIAFGVNDAKQRLGDILVSRQLMLYDLQRVGQQQIVPRGDRVHASTWLIDYLTSAELDWSGATVRFGLVLTGEKLVDNLNYREQLKKLEVEAIGGEMEGAGLYVACQDAKVDWVLVKSICDFADGNKGQDKDTRQQQAAKIAADFIVHALRHAPLQRTSAAPQTPWSRAAASTPTQQQDIGQIVVSGIGNSIVIQQTHRGERHSGASQSTPRGTTGPIQRRPTRNSLRTLLGQVLRTSSDLQSFLIDWFPKVAHQVASGMPRNACEDLLLQQHDTEEILTSLRELDAHAVLRYESSLEWSER